MTVTRRDLNEVATFCEFLDDLGGKISPEDFAEKWHEYMGVDKDFAERYARSKRK